MNDIWNRGSESSTQQKLQLSSDWENIIKLIDFSYFFFFQIDKVTNILKKKTSYRKRKIVS